MCNCPCDGLGYYVANVLYVLERLASCCALTALVSCIVATILIMMGMGIGLGFNYCTIEQRMKLMENVRSGGGNGSRRRQEPWDDYVNKDSRRILSTKEPVTSAGSTTQKYKPSRRTPGFPKPLRGATRTTLKDVKSVVTRTEAYQEYGIKPTMIVPLNKIGLLSLIMKLKKINRNVTLELLSI